MKKELKSARSTVAAIGLLALVGAIPANAADLIGEEPPVPAAPMEEPPLATWSGAYAGVTVGYGFSGRTTDDLGGVNNEIGTDGFIGGAFVGYNYDAGGVVVGAEADVGYNWMDGTNAGVASDSGVEGSLRARLGYAVMPNVLVYATAGGAAKQLELSDAAGSDKQTMLGWTAGAGADVLITDNIFGRVEYRYTDFGSETFNTGAGGDRNVDDKGHRINFGVGMKF